MPYDSTFAELRKRLMSSKTELIAVNDYIAFNSAMHASSSFTVNRIPVFTLAAGIGLTLGFLVPVAYEWMQEPWNRSRLLAMELAAIATAALTCVACLALARFGKQTPSTPARRSPIQFSLLHLFTVTTLTAVLLALGKWLDISWASGLVAVVALGVLGWSLTQDAGVSARMAALVASLFSPQVWMVAYNEPFGSASGLVAALPLAPAILLAELIRAFTSRGGPDEAAVFAGLIVIAELLWGAWRAHRGGKLFVAYLLLMLLQSCLGSFGMHALYRA